MVALSGPVKNKGIHDGNQINEKGKNNFIGVSFIYQLTNCLVGSSFVLPARSAEEEYYLGLLYTTMSVLTFQDVNAIKKLFALQSAALIYEKLLEFNNK